MIPTISTRPPQTPSSLLAPSDSSIHILEGAAILLALWMICQQVLIANAPDDPWERTARRYKRHLRWAAGIATVIVLVVATMYVILKEDTRAFRDVLSPNRSTLMVIGIAFFVAILRLLMERAKDEPAEVPRFLKDLLRSFRGTIDPTKPLPQVERRVRAHRYDAWVWTFALLVVLEVAMRYLPSADVVTNLPIVHTTYVGPALLHVIVACAYFGWIYLGTFKKMTEVHHFSGIAAREYLGKLMEQTIPYQAVVIGPMRAGKTAFCAGKTIPDDQGRTSKLTATRFGTAGEINENTGCSAYVSLLDTPGENLGDHLAAISYYRTDVLVLVLRAEGLVEKRLAQEPEESLADIESFWEGEGHPVSTREYLTTLRRVLKRDDDPNAITRSFELYKVRKFVLFLNCEGWDESRIGRVMGSRGFQKMADLFGKRFGVPKENCFGLVAPSINGGAARDRIVKTYTLRRDLMAARAKSGAVDG